MASNPDPASCPQPNLPVSHDGVNRRALLGAAAAAGLALTAGASAAEPTIEGLPTRILGRTKQRVTILGLGTAPIGEGPVETKEAARIFGAVMDRGVNYLDTAYIYGNAEEALGQLVPRRRDKLFLVTKIWADTAERAETIFSTSLKRLKVDHVDLVHIHNIGGKNLEKVLGKGGVLEYLLKQQAAGKTRFLGLSGHCRPPYFLPLLKTGKIDVIMPVMNYSDVNTYGFEKTVLPEARTRNVGVVAMKVYVGIKGGFRNHKKGFVGCVTKKELLGQAMAYALDLPGVASAVVGPYTMEHALENVELAKRYKPLTDKHRADLLTLGKKLATEINPTRPRYGPVA